LSRSEWRWFYRGNFWPNTPDILPRHLQGAIPQMFRIRAALAAMLMPSWGIYSGYELCENEPLAGREEYMNSEKFQLMDRDWNAPGNIKGFIRQLNRVRHENRALHLYDNLVRHGADHDQMVVFSKSTPDFANRILCTISLDAEHIAASLVHLDLAGLGLDPARPYRVTDLLHGDSYEWLGASNYVSLNPSAVSMHVFQVEQ
jgi:starch synthase (maltosyl-transferring)